MKDSNYEVLTEEQINQYVTKFSTGFKNFPVGLNIKCKLDGAELTDNGLKVRLKFGPYKTEEGLIIRPRYIYKEYDRDSKLELMDLIYSLSSSAQFLDYTENPKSFFKDLVDKINQIDATVYIHTIEKKVDKIWKTFINSKIMLNKS